VHNVANVKAENPIVSANWLDAQRGARSYLKFFLVLKIVNFFKSLEGNFESFFLCKFMFEVVISLFCGKLTDGGEFLLNFEQLLHNEHTML